MRLRRKPWVDEAIHAYDDFVYPKDRPAGEAERGRWKEIFGREAPLFVELGTGKGEFIRQMAERAPEVNFIGIEKQQDVLIAAAKKVREKELKNVRLLVFDIAQLEKIFAPGEVDRFFVNFCDPWPKARHHKRRLIQTPFVRELVAALQPGGYLHLATDWQDYADQMAEVLASIDTLVAEPPRPLPSPSLPCPRPSTRFERRGERLGHGITDLIRYKHA